MMRALPLLALLVTACAQVAPPAPSPAARVIPTGPPPASYGWDASTQVLETDLLATARERFGEAAVRQAFAAPTYLFAKFYHGMLPPPQPGDAPYQPPMALLIRENGQWLAATASGWRAPHPDRLAEIEAVLASEAFWSAPTRGTPSCTDAGASLLLLKVPQRPETIRNGTCGPTQPNERLVMTAYDAGR